MAKSPKYTKEALVSSVRFEKDRDILSAVLEDGKTYSITEAQKAINAYKAKTL